MQDLIIDTDVASDDGIALMMALRNPEVRVVGITTVAGNVRVDQATRNALHILDVCRSQAPVFVGAAQSLRGQVHDAAYFHGSNGFSDVPYLESLQRPESLSATDALIRLAEQYPGATLVTLGPLTNIALALRREPRFAGLIQRCVVMGGAPCCAGNVTPAAEYNIWVDPEAAQAAMRSGLPIELVGWQLSDGPAALNEEDLVRIAGLGTSWAKFALESSGKPQSLYFETSGNRGMTLPDPICMAIAIDPLIGLDASSHFVDVEVESPLCRGMTVVDRYNVAGDEYNKEAWKDILDKAARVKVYWAIDVPRWKQQLLIALGRG